MKPQSSKQACKHAVWFGYYLDRNSGTFLDGFRSAKKAGYNGNDNVLRAIASQNAKKYQEKIAQWLKEEGYTEVALKCKLLSLMEAKETKFFSHEGKITDQVEVEALETQRRSLDMAMKAEGMYAPERHLVDGNLTVEIIKFSDANKDTE